jgi:lipoate-protein ligase A
MELRVEPLHGGKGEAHMRRDEEIFLAMEAASDGPERLPMLRLYSWDEPTVSLGRGQTPETALSPRWEGWRQDPSSDPDGPAAVVKRPTGGRAVWHEEELTYSVVFPLDHPVFQGGGRTPEEFLGAWLLESGRRAGIEHLSLERGGSSRDPLGLGPAPCFASTSRHELKWHGLKWVGSARRLGKSSLLQHGAIRLGPAGDRLEAWLTGVLPKDERPWNRLPAPEVLARELESTLRDFTRTALIEAPTAQLG